MQKGIRPFSADDGLSIFSWNYLFNKLAGSALIPDEEKGESDHMGHG